jgi:Spy/CpxP family protein refolding chaperone
MKQRHLIQIIAIFAVSLMALGSVHAKLNKGEQRGRIKAMMKGIKAAGVERPVLRDIRQTLRKTRRSMVDLKAAIENAKIDLQELLEADEVNRDAVMKGIDRVAAAKANIQKKRVGTMLDIQAKLTPEQRSKVKAMMQSFKGKRGNKRPHRRQTQDD